MQYFALATAFALCGLTAAYPGLQGVPALYGRDIHSATFLKAKRALNLPEPLNITGFKKIPDAAHPFRAPGPNDKRGPCPGMNALANHGYINRTGVTTLTEGTHGCQEAFNFAYDVSLIFSFLGMWTGGNIETQQYSIGGPSDAVAPIVGANGTVLLKPVGMAYSHGNFEGDTSLTRLDWAIKHDSGSFNQKLYDGFVDHAYKYGDGKFTEKVIGEYRWTRWVQSNTTNKGLVFTPLQAFIGGGASSLFYDCYRNGTDRFTSKKNMDIFMGAKAGGIGHESFPPNWYRGGECTLEAIVQDSRFLYGMHPVPFKEGFQQTSYLPEATVHDFACHTLGYLVGQLTPKGTSELDQRLGAALGDWGPFLGGIFGAKFGCT